MKRSKPLDRLSQLPDSIIFDIFWFLTVTDVVRTTVLSKRWKNLSSTTPFLNFSDDRGINRNSFDQNSEKFRNFVNRVLLRWDGERILKFKVDWSRDHEKSIYVDIDLWLRFAKRNGVEELYLLLPRFDFSFHNAIESDDLKKEAYWVPQFLYSCSSFKELSFEYCNFRINGIVEWNQLKKLNIEEIGENYSFESTSLKELSIYKKFHYLYFLFEATELRIQTPNLESLEIRGLSFGRCLLLDISSLTRATLEMFGNEVNVEQCVFSIDDSLGDKLSRILPTIQHVENVTLSYCCIKALEISRRRCTFPSFPNVKSLEIKYCFNDYELLAKCLLDDFPRLRRLVLQGREEFEFHDEQESLDFDIKSYRKSEANLSNSFRLELRNVEVTWFKGDKIFPFIEFLLKYADKLEEIVFRVRAVYAGSNASYLAAQKLLKMPRSSPTARLIITEI